MGGIQLRIWIELNVLNGYNLYDNLIFLNHKLFEWNN